MHQKKTEPEINYIFHFPVFSQNYKINGYDILSPLGFKLNFLGQLDNLQLSIEFKSS